MLKGLVRTILSRPNRSLSVAEVRGDPEGSLAGDALLHGEQDTDVEGIKDIKRRLDEIDTITAETGGSESFTKEKLDLLRRLEKASKHIESPLRRAHHNIATQIRKFRDGMGEDMPLLAAHLKAALQLDFPHFRYCPPPGTGWKI